MEYQHVRGKGTNRKKERKGKEHPPTKKKKKEPGESEISGR